MTVRWAWEKLLELMTKAKLLELKEKLKNMNMKKCINFLKRKKETEGVDIPQKIVPDIEEDKFTFTPVEQPVLPRKKSKVALSIIDEEESIESRSGEIEILKDRVSSGIQGKFAAFMDQM